MTACPNHLPHQGDWPPSAVPALWGKIPEENWKDHDSYDPPHDKGKIFFFTTSDSSSYSRKGTTIRTMYNSQATTTITRIRPSRFLRKNKRRTGGTSMMSASSSSRCWLCLRSLLASSHITPDRRRPCSRPCPPGRRILRLSQARGEQKDRGRSRVTTSFSALPVAHLLKKERSPHMGCAGMGERRSRTNGRVPQPWSPLASHMGHCRGPREHSKVCFHSRRR